MHEMHPSLSTLSNLLLAPLFFANARVTTVSEQLSQLFLFPHFMATSWKKIRGIIVKYLGKRKVVQCNGVLVSFKCSRLTQCYCLDNFLL